MIPLLLMFSINEMNEKDEEVQRLKEENKKLSKEIKKNKKEDDEIRNKNCFFSKWIS